MNAQQLKNAILQEAIEGRLVPQDPNDEPASALLARIHKEKEQLVKAGKLKKKDLEVKPISEDEIPFEIPESWEWCRVKSISFKIVDGDHNPPKGLSCDSGYYMLSSKNVNNDGLVELDSVRYLSYEDWEKCNERTSLKKGDVLLTTVGTLGRSCVYEGDIPYCFQRSVSIIQTFVFNYYLKYSFDCPFFQSLIDDKATGTAQRGFYLNQLEDAIIPLPPLAEQKRIVAKIEELLPKVEEYGKAQEALDKLNAELPERLKKSILQEAITGRLVPQDPNDEPASVLLAKIRKEKEQLVKAGKLKKKDLIETPISEDEIPFEIPESWEWVRFGTITINRDSERIPLSVDERSRLEKKYDYYGASGVIDKVDRYLFNKPLLLIGEDGANLINRSTPIAFIARGEYWVNNHAHVLDYLNEDLMQYMCWYINAISLVDYVTGTAQPKMNQEKMNSILVALPPLAEQHRIVEKLEQLLGEIDKLKK